MSKLALFYKVHLIKKSTHPLRLLPTGLKSFQVAKHVVTNFAKVIVNVIQSNSVIGEGNVFVKRGERIVAVCFCVVLQLTPHSFNWFNSG